MIRTKIEFTDGTVLSSGQTGGNAILGVTLTRSVNNAEDIAPGSVCASAIEAEIITPSGAFSPAAGEEIVVYRGERGQEEQVGIFRLEKPERTSANRLKLTAFDRICQLEKDISSWLNQLDGWPYRLQEFASMVCDACDLTLITTEIPNGDWEISRFSADEITGRTLMGWVGEVSTRFCRATPAGEIELAWYAPTDRKISPDGENFYYQGSLQYGDYQVAPIEKVQIRMEDGDNGTVYPPDKGEANTYVITGNFLLATEDEARLQAVAESVYTRMAGISYTPGRVKVPAGLGVSCGEEVQITDKNGNVISFYVMSSETSGQVTTLECTGNRIRGQSGATNEEKYRALNGKLLHLSKTIQGLKIENRDLAGKSGELELTVDALTAQVSRQQTEGETTKTQMSALEQKTDALTISVSTIVRDGVDKVKTQTGYEFSEVGLKIQKSGEEMENRLDHTGMYVERSGEVILKANNAGVLATDVQVRNYLVIGDHARFEDYKSDEDSQRTGCFFI